MSPLFVENDHDLIRLCHALEDQPWITLDTEFMREHTFYAKLCLIQIATPELVACIDPLAVRTLTPFLEMLYQPRLLKIIHSARQDLEVFHDLCGAIPQPVFDTQIAAALLGYDEHIGYATLVELLTGIKLNKAQTRTNWANRPLQPEQIRYAEDDVRYLRDIFEHLRAELTRRRRLAWLEEECARLYDPSLYGSDPEQIYLRVKQGAYLGAAAQHTLRALFLWREQMARLHNTPRNWIVPDLELLALSRHAPKDPALLLEKKIIKPATWHKWGNDISAIMQVPRRPDLSSLWPEATRLDTHQKKLYSKISGVINQRAKEHQINVNLLAPRKEIERLILRPKETALARGWRREAFGDELLTLLSDAPA